MYIGVVHTITNGTTWEQKLHEFEDATLPDGYANPVTYVGSRTDYAFCLWDAPSVDALQSLLDGLTEGAATNMYFPIDPKAFGSAGLPAQLIDLNAKPPAMA